MRFQEYKAKYSVRAARTMKDVEDGQCDIVDDFCDTLAIAKKRARYLLTDDFQRSGEMSEPLRYAQVVRDEEVLWDVFRKGYNGEEAE
jgi:hypothetical protein